jgi:hypothetical protein
MIFFMLISALPVFAQTSPQRTQHVAWDVDFSAPILNQNDGFIDVRITEIDGIMTKEGCPRLPMYTKTFEFPLGTQVTSVEVTQSPSTTMTVRHPVRPVPLNQQIGNQIIPQEGQPDPEVYSSDEAYPSSWFTVTTGAGLNTNNEHVLFVCCHITPVRYRPAESFLEYCSQFSVEVTYEPPSSSPRTSEVYSLVIISPAEFAEQLQPLVTHKNGYGMSTILVTLEEISSSYLGRDDPENMKLFIRDAVEDWDTHYVLLVGDTKKLPIRVTYANWWEPDILSDLYYADIYDSLGEFCTWDANHNNRFGEIDHDGNDLDGVDLYPDVHVGRLACADATEVQTVMNKIITYEEETSTQIWFKRIICAGGDTFPVSYGAPPFIYEGEITNIKVGQTIPEFDQTYLWTSKYALRPSSFNREINKGAGFVTYAGHGFEHGWATYRPNSITRQAIMYYMPYMNGLKNGNKLPVIFFDACLTAKLDFNFTDLEEYYPRIIDLLASIFGLSTNPSDFYQCFAWSFIAKESGGAIASVGATRTAYTWVDSTGVYGGAGYMDVHFFDSYYEGVTVGQMLTGSQNAYIHQVGPDYFTIEEFILLGDPSLMVGGYP